VRNSAPLCKPKGCGAFRNYRGEIWDDGLIRTGINPESRGITERNQQGT
jgi:hypothetical protein